MIIRILTILIIIISYIELAQQQYISIKKPYEKLCDTTTPTKEELIIIDFDQNANETSCPRPSDLIGCSCDKKEFKLKCVYANVLNKIPQFTNQYDVDSYKWSLDLKCKNTLLVNDLSGLIPLKHVKYLDLSAYLTQNDFYKNCKSSGSFTLVNLTKIGLNVYNEPSLNSATFKKHLIIDNLILDYNKIEKIYLNKINLEFYAGGLESNLNRFYKYSFRIKNLSIAHNKLEDLNNIKYNLDICYLELTRLNAAHNRISIMDVSFLVYLTHLNVSHNNLKAYSFSTFEESLSIQCNNIQWAYDVNSGNINNNKSKLIYISNLKHLDISYNHLISVPFSHFKHVNFTHLEYLNLNHNKLNYLQAYDFITMKNLKHLFLDGNRLVDIDLKTFLNVIHLKHLDINSNHNEKSLNLSAKLFKDPGKSLEHLSLERINLDHLPKESLKYCFKVKHLYLNGNKIKSLPAYSFGFMYNLLELYLSSNHLEDIDQNAFSIDEQSILGPGLIEKLDLSYNRLTKLQANMFSFLTNLRYLLLNNNRIKEIDPNALFGINYLIMLDLSLNQIDRLNFLSNRNLSHLRYLKLSNNQIKRLRPAQFMCLKSIKTLDLSSNKIKSITDCAFHGLQKTIKKLILNFNLITKLNTCAFTLDYNTIRFVQVGQNPLKCTSNCEFYFAVFTHPYSIDYLGLECDSESELFKIKHTSNFSYCSQKQYSRIHDSCKDMEKFCSRNLTNYEVDCEYKPIELEKVFDEENEDNLDPFRRRLIENKSTHFKLNFFILLINFFTFFV